MTDKWENPRNRSFVRDNILFMLLACIIMFLCWFVSKHYFQLMLIQGESMSPAFHNLQLVVLDKRDKVYEAGDVVAFSCEGLSAVLVKRIAACPGDTALISDGILYVNGEKSTLYCETVFNYAGILEENKTLQIEEYIVFGDNIDDSIDSRYEQVGVVSGDMIIGKIWEGNQTV